MIRILRILWRLPMAVRLVYWRRKVERERQRQWALQRENILLRRKL
jgi:hypothetical protein